MVVRHELRVRDGLCSSSRTVDYSSIHEAAFMLWFGMIMQAYSFMDTVTLLDVTMLRVIFRRLPASNATYRPPIYSGLYALTPPAFMSSRNAIVAY